MHNVALEELPQAVPHCCFGCGTGEVSRGPYADLGVHLEFHGAVQLCRLCTNYMAGTLGYVSEENFRDAFDYIKRLEDHVLQLQEIESNLRGTIEQLVSNSFVDSIELDDSLIRFDFSQVLSDQSKKSAELIREYERLAEIRELERQEELESEGDGVLESSDDEGMAIVPDVRHDKQTKLFSL